MQLIINSLDKTIVKHIDSDITCRETFELAHQATSIPLNKMRITMGSRELYPIEENLTNGRENKIILTLKLRICGGVKDS